MSTIKQRYTQLLNLTQIFLLREYALQDVNAIDPAHFAFFQRRLKTTSPQPLPKKISPAPPIQNSPRPPSPSPLPPTPPQQTALPPLPPPSNPKTTPTENQPFVHPVQEKNKIFSLEPLPATIPSNDFREYWKLCQTLFPHWILCEKTPSDSAAQKHKNAWMKEQEIPPIVILSFHENEQQGTFLKNVAQAISLRLASARVLSADKLEKENAWEKVLNSPQLRLIIASDYGLYLQSKLMHFYREEPQHGKHFLHQTPLLLLSDIALYLKQPQLKPLLWRAICNEFSASQRH